MCVAVPMRITSIDDDTAITEIDGVKREANLMLLGDEVKVGDFVIVHAALPSPGWMKKSPVKPWP